MVNSIYAFSEHESSDNISDIFWAIIFSTVWNIIVPFNFSRVRWIRNEVDAQKDNSTANKNVENVQTSCNFGVPYIHIMYIRANKHILKYTCIDIRNGCKHYILCSDGTDFMPSQSKWSDIWWHNGTFSWYSYFLDIDVSFYPMLRADSRFWLVNNREIWSRISRLTSSAWDIKTKERHWWRHNGDSDRRPLSLPLRYDLVTLCLYDDLGQINVIAGILKLRKRFRMSQILFEHGINSLPLVCFPGYGNLSTLSIAIPRLAFGRAWYRDAACG